MKKKLDIKVDNINGNIISVLLDPAQYSMRYDNELNSFLNSKSNFV